MTATEAAALLLSATAKAAGILLLASMAAAACRRQSASVRHGLWTTALLAVLFLPVAERVAPPTSIQVPAAAASLARPFVTIGEAGLRDSAMEIPAALVSQTVAPVAGRTGATGPLASRASRWVLVIWMTGALLVLGRLALDLERVRGLVRKARALDAGAVGGPIPPDVSLVESPDALSPMTVGLWRAAILLPPGFVARPPDEVRAAVVHELGHVKRRDVLTLVFGRCICALHWFNPLAGYALHSMRREAESACDDLALASGLSAVAYADALVTAAATASGRLSHAGLRMAGARDLERRLDAILRPGTRRDILTARHAAILYGALAAVLTGVGGLSLSAAAPLTVVPSPASSSTEPSWLRGETLPVARAIEKPKRARGVIDGPDARLIRLLMTASTRKPAHDFDLVGERARWALARVKEDQLVTPLIALLESGDDREAEHAAWVLALDARPHVVSPLVAAMAHPSWRVRANAAAGLARLAPPAALDAMRTAVRDSAWQVRLEAATYFGERSDDVSIDYVRALLRDPHAGVRAHAEGVLQGANSRRP